MMALSANTLKHNTINNDSKTLRGKHACVSNIRDESNCYNDIILHDADYDGLCNKIEVSFCC